MSCQKGNPERKKIKINIFWIFLLCFLLKFHLLQDKEIENFRKKFMFSTPSLYITLMLKNPPKLLKRMKKNLPKYYTFLVEILYLTTHPLSSLKHHETTNLLSPNKISQFFTYCYRYSGCWYMYSKSSQWRVRVTLTRHPNMVLCHYLEACAWTLQTKYVYVHVWNIWLILNKNDLHNYDKLKIVFYNNKNTVIFQNFF